jgi:hypothetical protein
MKIATYYLATIFTSTQPDWRPGYQYSDPAFLIIAKKSIAKEKFSYQECRYRP